MQDKNEFHEIGDHNSCTSLIKNTGFQKPDTSIQILKWGVGR